MDKNETGKDGVLIVNGEEIPFTNADYELSYGTTSSDFNDEMEQSTAYTNKTHTGSIEAEGSKAELKRQLLDADGMPRDDIRLQINGSEGGDRFTDVKIETFGREFPGGDKTTTTIDWKADHHRPINL